MALLRLDEVRVSYGPAPALRGISLTVDDGEIVSLIGANGAGKTTTLRAVSRLLPLGGGSIVFADRNLAPLSPDAVVRLGLAHCPEGRQVLTGMTVRDNLELGAWVRRDRDAIREDLERMYRRFPRLRERKDQPAGTLSGGEQQILAIARALMSRPRLLILDEPSLGLAPLLVREIFAIIAELNAEGVAILLVEQNARLAMQHSHRTFVLDAGEIVLAGKSADLLADERVIRSYLGE